MSLGTPRQDSISPSFNAESERVKKGCLFPLLVNTTDFKGASRTTKPLKKKEVTKAPQKLTEKNVPGTNMKFILVNSNQDYQTEMSK